MRSEVKPHEDVAERMRREFDLAFARPPAPLEEVGDDVLRIAVAGVSLAIRVRDLAGLFAGLAVTALPGPVRELAGLAGLRGDLVPVFDLGQLLGREAVKDPGRWVALLRAPERVAVTFDAAAGYVRVPRRDVVTALDEDASRSPRLVRGAVRVGGGTFPLLDLSALLAEIRRRSRSRETSSELDR